MGRMRQAGKKVSAGLAALLMLAGGASARPMTPEDLAAMPRVADPRVSPDGSQVLYAVRTVDLAANNTKTSLWIAPLKARIAPREVKAGEEGASQARWSSDGKAIYFVARRKGGAQLYRTDVGGATATQITSLPLDVEAYRLSPDEKQLVVALRVHPECPTLACTAERDAKAKDSKATGQIFDRLFVRHWDTWLDGKRNHLFALTLDADGKATGAPTPLMPGFDGDSPGRPFGGSEDFTFTHDGKTIIFAARLAGNSEPWSTNSDLWRVPADGTAKPVNLTEANRATDTGPVISPDGRTLAWRAMKRPGFEADRSAIMVRDLASGHTREVAPSWDRSADGLVWSEDGASLLTLADDLGQRRVFQVEVASGRVTPLTGAGRATAMDAAAGALVFMGDAIDRPPALFAVAPQSGQAPIKIADPSGEAAKDIDRPSFEQFQFKGWNGATVYGHVVRPAGYEEGQTYPVAFLIHGGPQGSFGNLWHWRWNAATFAGMGYAVVQIDFHGSTGYGQAFTDAISQHWGDRPLEDLQKGWAAALERYPYLDRNRACALGASYGGYMVNWIAGTWSDPWKCLVNHDGVFDNRAMGYATEELWFTEWEHGGTPFDNPEGYERFNPVRHVAKWKVPMMVIQGGRDYRIPTEQALATFTALQRRGIPSRLIYFDDENHWVQKPANQVQWYREVGRWLDSHTPAPAR